MFWYTLIIVGSLVAGGAFNASRVDAFVERNHHYLKQMEARKNNNK
tara:strand:+ start:2163 stop:2300 length:138 start_codon:yes stop_codon:yes gene_type:complete